MAQDTAKVRWTVVLIAIPVLVILTAWFIPPVWAWVATLVLLLVFVTVAGRQILGLWRGALIDERNKVSLSRFQTVLWMVLVVAGFLVAAVHNVRAGQANPLKIAIPAELWALLGISVTSLVGSGLIKQEKAKTAPDHEPAVVMLAKAKKISRETVVPVDGSKTIVVKADPAAPPSADNPVVARGVLAVNDMPDQSSWLDMFGTEEVGNINHLDIGKIQMFYFTIIIVFAYGVALTSLFAGKSSGKIDAFPALSPSVIALLGISQAAYLANKAVPRTPTE